MPSFNRTRTSNDHVDRSKRDKHGDTCSRACLMSWLKSATDPHKQQIMSEQNISTLVHAMNMPREIAANMMKSSIQLSPATRFHVLRGFEQYLPGVQVCWVQLMQHKRRGFSVGLLFSGLQFLPLGFATPEGKVYVTDELVEPRGADPVVVFVAHRRFAAESHGWRFVGRDSESGSQMPAMPSFEEIKQGLADASQHVHAQTKQIIENLPLSNKLRAKLGFPSKKPASKEALREAHMMKWLAMQDEDEQDQRQHMTILRGEIVGRANAAQPCWLAAWLKQGRRYVLEQLQIDLPESSRVNLSYRDALTVAFFACWFIPSMRGNCIGFGSGHIFRRINNEAPLGAIQRSISDTERSTKQQLRTSGLEQFFAHIMKEPFDFEPALLEQVNGRDLVALTMDRHSERFRFRFSSEVQQPEIDYVLSLEARLNRFLAVSTFLEDNSNKGGGLTEDTATLADVCEIDRQLLQDPFQSVFGLIPRDFPMDVPDDGEPVLLPPVESMIHMRLHAFFTDRFSRYEYERVVRGHVSSAAEPHHVASAGQLAIDRADNRDSEWQFRRALSCLIADLHLPYRHTISMKSTVIKNKVSLNLSASPIWLMPKSRYDAATNSWQEYSDVERAQMCVEYNLRVGLMLIYLVNVINKNITLIDLQITLDQHDAKSMNELRKYVADHVEQLVMDQQGDRFNPGDILGEPVEPTTRAEIERREELMRQRRDQRNRDDDAGFDLDMLRKAMLGDDDAHENESSSKISKISKTGSSSGPSNDGRDVSADSINWEQRFEQVVHDFKLDIDPSGQSGHPQREHEWQDWLHHDRDDERLARGAVDAGAASSDHSNISNDASADVSSDHANAESADEQLGAVADMGSGRTHQDRDPQEDRELEHDHAHSTDLDQAEPVDNDTSHSQQSRGEKAHGQQPYGQQTPDHNAQGQQTYDHNTQGQQTYDQQGSMLAKSDEVTNPLLFDEEFGQDFVNPASVTDDSRYQVRIENGTVQVVPVVSLQADPRVVADKLFESDIDNPIELAALFGAHMSIHPTKGFEPIEWSFNNQDEEFQPEFSKKRPESLGLVFDAYEASVLGAATSSDIAIDRNSYLDHAAGELEHIADDETLTSVQKAQKAAQIFDDLADPLFSLHKDDIIRRMIDGERVKATDIPHDVQATRIRMDIESYFMRQEFDKVYAVAGRELYELDKLFESGSGVPRAFSTYAERVAYNRLFASPNETVVLIPDDLFAAHIRLAGIAAQFNRTDIALEQLNRLISYAPTSAMVHMKLGELLASCRDWNSARAAFLNAIQVAFDKNDASQAYADFAYSEWMRGALPTAAAAYMVSIQLSKDGNPRAVHELMQVKAKAQSQCIKTPHTYQEAVFVLNREGVKAWEDQEFMPIMREGTIVLVDRGLLTCARSLVIVWAASEGVPHEYIDETQQALLQSFL